jgi:hypothetical protein
MYKSAQWINQTVHAAYQLYNPRTNNPLAFTVHGASLSGDMDMDEFVEFVNKTPLTPGAYIDVAFTQEDILISDPAGFPHIHKPGVLITLTGSYNFGTGVGTILKRTGAAGGALFSIRGGEWIIQGVKLDSTDCSPCFQALDAKIKLGNNPGAQGPLNVFLSGGASGTGGRLLDIENSYVWGKWNRFENVGASADWLLHANHNCYVDMQRTEFWNTGSGNCVEIIRGSHADVAISDFNGKVAGPAGVALRCTNNCWASSGASTMDNFANGNIVNGLRDYINAFNITYTNVTTQNNITTDTMDATGNFINT